MVTARRLSKKSTQEHYIIIKRATDKEPIKRKEKAKRQKLWCTDLKRFGISTLLIDDYDELKDILVSISQSSRGKTVYITGSHKNGNEVARELGMKLAEEKDIILISGQSAGIGADAVSAFTEQCIVKQLDVSDRMRIFPNPYAANPKFSNDLSLLPELKKYRAKLFNSTQIVVVFSGRDGTEAEVEVAINRNCKIIPAIVIPEDRDNDVIKQIINNGSIMEMIKEVDKEYHDKLLDTVVSTEDIFRCLMRLVK